MAGLHPPQLRRQVQLTRDAGLLLSLRLVWGIAVAWSVSQLRLCIPASTRYPYGLSPINGAQSLVQARQL